MFGIKIRELSESLFKRCMKRFNVARDTEIGYVQWLQKSAKSMDHQWKQNVKRNNYKSKAEARFFQAIADRRKELAFRVNVREKSFNARPRQPAW